MHENDSANAIANVTNFQQREWINFVHSNPIIWMYFFIDGWNSFINQFNCELQHVNKKKVKTIHPGTFSLMKNICCSVSKNRFFIFFQVIKKVLYSFFLIVFRIDSHRLDLISDHEPFFLVLSVGNVIKL